MLELTGDSARGADWAFVRLRVDGQTIVAAESPGVAEDLRGLSLLEAAAVGGETLPVDALANALAPAIRAPADPERVVVAMSGGVDSAVALLRAGPAAVGATLRLWLDPHGPDAERACCSPDAVIAAREACHRLGLAHVTLDRREAFRRAVVTPFVRGYARGETPNPCVRCNGGFRFAELLALARRLGAARLATGHYARIVERDGMLLLARAADEQKDQSYMLARLDPRLLTRVWFPLGEQSKDATRAEAARAGLAAANRPESQEACFLAGDDYRSFLERSGLEARPGPIVDEEGAVIGSHTGHWSFTPGQRRGLGVAAAGAALRARHRSPHEHRPRRATAVARPVERLGSRQALRPDRAGCRQAALSLAGDPYGGAGNRAGVPARPGRAGVRRGSRPGRRPLRRRRRGRFGLGHLVGDRLVCAGWSSRGQKAGLLPRVANATSKRSEELHA